MTRTTLTDLAVWAEARLPRLTEETHAAILDRIPLYLQDGLVPAEDLHRSVALNLRSMITAIGHPQAPLDLTAPRDTGRHRAHQGVPLPEVLRAYRISFGTLWDALVEYSRSGRQSAAAEDALLTTASMIWQLTDEHAVALTEAYRSAMAELLLAEQRRRSALVEALLSGHPGPDAGPWEAAALLGLPTDAQQVVVAADTRGLAEESLPGIERRLADRKIVSGWRLTPAMQLGVVSLDTDKGDTVLAVLQEAASARVGVSPPYRLLTETPRALQLALAALAAIPAGQVEVRMFNPSPLAAVMACEPGEGRRLAKEVLGAVLELSPEDNGVLLDTLYAYLDHAGSAKDAADAIYCHPNTVRYRLRRLQSLTGRSLSDPQGSAELAAAAYALRFSSDPALLPGRLAPRANARPPAVPAANGRPRRPQTSG
jgi:hypothetical protein